MCAHTHTLHLPATCNIHPISAPVSERALTSHTRNRQRNFPHNKTHRCRCQCGRRGRAERERVHTASHRNKFLRKRRFNMTEYLCGTSLMRTRATRVRRSCAATADVYNLACVCVYVCRMCVKLCLYYNALTVSDMWPLLRVFVAVMLAFENLYTLCTRIMPVVNCVVGWLAP